MEPSDKTKTDPSVKKKKTVAEDNIYGQGDDKTVPVAGKKVQGLENDFKNWFD